MNNSVRPPMPTVPPPMNVGKPSYLPPTEPTFRERVDRVKTLLRRAFRYWKMSLFLLVVGCGIAVFVAANVKRVYQCSVTMSLRRDIRTSKNEDISDSDPAKLKGRLNDMIRTRPRLEAAIKKFNLYPGMVDARPIEQVTEEMAKHVAIKGGDNNLFIAMYDGDDKQVVENVTRWLAQSVIDDYTSANLGDIKRDSDFLNEQQKTAEADLEKATRELTVFLTQHPEFALVQRSGQGGGAIGATPVMTGMPVLPNIPKEKGPPLDPALEAAYRNDPQLAALYRQRARLEGEIKSAAATPTPAPAPTVNNAKSVEQAQVDVDSAAKAVAQSQVELQNLRNIGQTEEHPDFRRATKSAENAAAQLKAAKARLAQLQLQAANPGVVVDSTADPELVAKIRDINNQIAARQAEIQRAQGKNPTAVASPAGSAAASAAPAIPVNPVVALETEWQRLLRTMTESKSRHDDMKRSAEEARLKVNAALAAASAKMSISDAGYAKPIKGKTTTGIIGLALALMVAFGYAGLRVLFNDTILDAQDVEAMNVIPVLGVVPRIHVTQAPAVASSSPPGANKAGANKGGIPGAA